MKAPHYDTKDDVLLDPFDAAWNKTADEVLDMMPAPVAMVQHLSPFMALSKDHGKIRRVTVNAQHNGRRLSIRLVWADDSSDTEIKDLDQFTDAAAVMFPMNKGANAITMGDEQNPVNAWFWKAGSAEPHDILAHGFGTSRRRPAKVSGLRATSSYADGRWHVVFQRSLRPGTGLSDQVAFKPAAPIGIAVALWAGSNRERAGQKSISGEWTAFEVTS
ncbi:MAG TPA: ethylbenzene dehydrogenase-related protein [Gammaproteobacteria bacterium]|jgi:DMSO reductase family type II enzyme heme b subunit|nr:ethylbenzene dehydrogenase-related protein [Gammaproteobacteria bacterium]